MSVDLEKILRPVDSPMEPYEPKYMLLASGEAVTMIFYCLIAYRIIFVIRVRLHHS